MRIDKKRMIKLMNKKAIAFRKLNKSWDIKGQKWSDTWYWVTNGKSVWLAMYDPKAANGWTNGDTWEDFGKIVIAWMMAYVPPIRPIK